MQGRLSPLIGGRIQAFPWSCWADEFPAAERLGFRLMEWTLDQDRLHENPLMTREGQAQIRGLCQRHQLSIPSITGDCFMQAPFWKAVGAERDGLQRDFRAVAAACSSVGISLLVVPLVDGGGLETTAQEKILTDFLRAESEFLVEQRLRVAFECDFAPAELARFIGTLDSAVFGVNYDIGNSASLGFHPATEIRAYGQRIFNVHVKDRALKGTTVPLGAGDADFASVFAALGQIRYAGNYILQTARSADGDHASALVRYRDMTSGWIGTYGA